MSKVNNSNDNTGCQIRRKNSYEGLGRVKVVSPILRRVIFSDGHNCDVRTLQMSRDGRFFARKTLTRDYSR